ncbi:MAG: hypothetical protein K2Q17_15620 [Nitrospiraceae bacterium]|jgi:hypothetical protein|uniref:hypothetical protein n=1 Tax=Nitrospira cf. moscoviensis SBR1015 TaxID=96242 RepID=UPI000A0B8BB4|nr:hypothetical protein [Nitrospira cf. moscoviensis SBR1015]MBY0249087.1 hypothetical protein [Nitrospiraceae bacterium]OQW36589.1 MAG: hypothetical protein A4E20_06820 [Nitrospira sp. SG-bin2]
MNKISKVILTIEAVAITPLSIEGIYIALSVMTSFVIGLPDQGKFNFIEFITATIIVCALISGYRIFGWVITSGPTRGISISPAWWVFAALGAVLAVLSSFDCVHELLGLPIEPPSFVDVAQLGVVFLIPFGHIIIEVIWQRHAYRRQLAIEDKNLSGTSIGPRDMN